MSAIHKPEADGADSRNHHAHLLLTTRILELDEKLGAKSNFEESDTRLKNKNLPIGNTAGQTTSASMGRIYK